MMRRLDSERGFTLIEVLVAMTLLSCGLFSTITSLDFSRHLTTNGEKLDAAAQVAEQEIEKIESLPYDQMALKSDSIQCTGTTDPNDPDYDVRNCDTTPTLAWDDNLAHTEPLVGAGNIVMGPSAWESPDHRLKGNIYRFVSSLGETSVGCTGSCNGTTDYKRITVMVTLTGDRNQNDTPARPVKVSTIAADPCAGPGPLHVCTS